MKKIIVMIGLAFLLTSCGALPFGSNWNEYNSETHNVHFEFPEDWIVEELADTINIGSSEDTLSSEIADGAGASITPAATSEFNGETEPLEILNLFREFFETGRDELEIVMEPQSTTINDLPAATMSYRGAIAEQSGEFAVTIIVQDTESILILTIDGSPDGRYGDTLERLAQSVEFR